ncbi:hypothetical protein MKK63_30895 [Methylobacterium sp. J-088]|uniref:hypothetical protein n=1 Tax=unclassified Methylobacterium TaxID=2615210 RepID=UPI001FBB3AEE|nr:MULTISPECIES: hypothetical protein [unclassified Methylobacterium]MCJ2067064.1 hypothetical protein [Methylobacterium sp. J-088]
MWYVAITAPRLPSAWLISASRSFRSIVTDRTAGAASVTRRNSAMRAGVAKAAEPMEDMALDRFGGA